MKRDFWSLIGENNIVIPSIQRDYAHGRDTEQATAIREKLLAALIDAIDHNRPIHLDFIYGKVKGFLEQEILESNRSNIENILKSIRGYANNLSLEFSYQLEENQSSLARYRDFIPLDGQQRLTTLFILHWYLFFRLGDNAGLESLSRFEYQTRSASRDFLSSLCQLDPSLVQLDKVLSEEILFQKDIFLGWRQDPTVMGILTVVDMLHGLLGKRDTQSLGTMRDRLIGGECITFDYLDLDRFELTDELYVKMNARGKQLSDFEHFKVWMAGFELRKNICIAIPEWKAHMDVSWLDIFWRHKGRSTFSVDDAYLMYFKLAYMGDLISTLQTQQGQFIEILDRWKPSAHGDLVLELERLRSVEEFFDPNKSLDWRLFATGLPRYLKSLELISTRSGLLEEIGSLSGMDFGYKYIECTPGAMLLGDRSKSLGWSGAAFHSYLLGYIQHMGHSLAEYSAEELLSFARMTRVMMNLIYNQRIESGPAYRQVVRGIRETLSGYFGSGETSVYEYFSANQGEITGMSAYQSTEESLKSSLICGNPDWEEAFVLAENNHYFYGQVGFILNLSALDIVSFRQYSEKLIALFSPEILEHSEHILQRALLTKGNYLINKGINKSFLLNGSGTLRERNENWRLLFVDLGKLELLRALVLDPLYDFRQPVASLKAIIAHAMPALTGYTASFVSDHRLINYCAQRHLREGKFGGDGRIFLLNATMISGIHRELKTLVIFEQLRDHFLEQHLLEQPGTPVGECYVRFDRVCTYHAVKQLINEPFVEIRAGARYMLTHPGDVNSPELFLNGERVNPGEDLLGFLITLIEQYV